ncbi:MAG: rhodanese-like domain-containing protein [Pseudomonadota bacterium]
MNAPKFIDLLLAVLLFVSVPQFAFAETDSSVEEVSVIELLTHDKRAVVLDVRSAREFNSGHIANALNIDIDSDNFAERIASLDRSKTYIVHCAANVSGGRSERAMNIMWRAGFGKLKNLTGGYAAWVAYGGEVVANNSQ